jgi:Fe/S biogenesis protein NfuA
MTLTDIAREKIVALMEGEENKNLALRVAIRGRGPGGFNYDLGFVDADAQEEGDTVIDGGGFKVYVDKDSAVKLQGATLDFVEEQYESGFKIDNPNPLWDDPTAQKVQEVIDERINPGIRSHGGWVALLEVKGDTAYIQLGGGCQGCGMVDVTLKQGIEVMIKEQVPQITKIIDTTDHAGGDNPYYQPSKGGGPSALG